MMWRVDERTRTKTYQHQICHTVIYRILAEVSRWFRKQILAHCVTTELVFINKNGLIMIFCVYTIVV